MKQRTCFVICPIGDDGSEIRSDADLLHDFILKPVLSTAPFSMTVSRADKLGQPGIITNQIIYAIETADLVVADLSMGNPNVFYEVAIRHVTRKPFVHLIRRGERIPFDNAPVRAIDFDLRDLRSVEAAKNELTVQAQIALEKGVSESPVSIAATLETLRQSGNSEQIAVAEMLAEIASVRNAIDRLQATVGASKPTPPPNGMFGGPTRASGPTKTITFGDLAQLAAAYDAQDGPKENYLGAKLADLIKVTDPAALNTKPSK